MLHSQLVAHFAGKRIHGGLTKVHDPDSGGISLGSCNQEAQTRGHCTCMKAVSDHKQCSRKSIVNQYRERARSISSGEGS